MREFIRYVVVGFFNVAIVFVVVNVLVFLTGVYGGVGLLVINAAAFVAALVNSYFWNRSWAFGAPAYRGAHTFFLFSLVTVLGFLLQSGTIYILTTLVAPPAGFSPHGWVNGVLMVAVLVGIGWNFSGYKFVVFRKTREVVGARPLRLLMLTQKVDADDDLLGIYHSWIKELAKQCGRISVICLFRGRVDLPENVSVFSLGKERGVGRVTWLINFYRLIFKLRKNYDVVFVHMNTIYVLLGWKLWRLFGKSIVLWFAHYRPNWQLRLSNLLVDRIVTSVPEACAIRSKKITVVGQGIDTEKFKSKSSKVKYETDIFRLLFLGRISPVKDLETLISAFKILKERISGARLTIVGEPTEKDRGYFKRIVAAAHEIPDIEFRGRVPNIETPVIYASNDVFVNLTMMGSFDKSILEAMAMELPVVVSNRAYEHILPAELRSVLMFRGHDIQDLAEKLEKIAVLHFEERARIGNILRVIVVRDHNIVHLADRLVLVFKGL